MAGAGKKRAAAWALGHKSRIVANMSTGSLELALIARQEWPETAPDPDDLFDVLVSVDG